MELPNYGWQLLPQLCTLFKEQHFYTFFIGNVHFRAHKVVVAAASLLFKSLLDSTDTISIDASVATPEEFALLLEMMYSDKLPLGKHNFTRVTSVADSLQMFDVGVSCKNLVRDLISCSALTVVRGVSSQGADSSGNQAEPNYLSQSGRSDEEKKHIILTQRVSPLPGPIETEMEESISPPGQEFTVNHTWLQMLSGSRFLQEDSGSGPDQPAHAESGCMDQELAWPLEEKGQSRDLAAESKSCKLDFFVDMKVFSEVLSDAQAVLKRLEKCKEIDASQKEALAACLAKAEELSVLKKLLGKVKNAHTQDSDTQDAQPLDTQTLVSFLKLFQDTNPELRVALLGREQSSGEDPQQAESTAEEERLTACLLCCREELIQSVAQLSPITELEAGEKGFLTASEKWVVLACCEGSSQREAMDNLLRKVDEEKTLKVKLLGTVKASCPGLQLLLDSLVGTANISDGKGKWSPEDYRARLLGQYQENFLELLTNTQVLLQCISAAWREMCSVLLVTIKMVIAISMGLLTEGRGQKPGIRRWKVNNESQFEVLDKDKDKAGGASGKEAKESQDKASSKGSFVCKACDKVFPFCCHLKVHMKCCQMARGKQIHCKECGKVKSTKKELEKHQLEVHGMVDAKKEKRFPVACDICGREFAHASGMQYHKLTEHLEEKPFSCQECGAKLVASSMKNHLWLPTGDWPFMCKHCLMTFMQGLALAFHTKKKNAEADIEDPYDCKKCQMSFATLQEHHKHVHEAHSWEYHPCPTSSNIFSAPLLLVLLVTHDGGKPFTCDMCNKAYQQLSGLYHHRTHHPDVFAAQNHCSSKLSSLQCSCCDKTFTLAVPGQTQTVPPTGSQPFCCWYCSMAFCSLGALQSHVTSQHFTQTGSTFICELCGELFPSQCKLEGHLSTQHPKVAFQTTAAQTVQVTQTLDQGAAEHIISFDDANLVMLPKSQVSQAVSELVTVTMENLFEPVTLISEEIK
ncbi:LOW QUALITY PROTEIN: zinc finger and BTB domain-containing protein 40 [Sylvia borin]